MQVWTYICSVSPNFVFLDIVEGSFETDTLRRLLVILEEELKRTRGDPDFRMIHRQGRF